MRTHWIGPIALVGVGAAAALVLAGRPRPVEVVTADPSVVELVAPQPQPQPLEVAPALKTPILPEAHRAPRPVAEPLKVDMVDPWTGRDLGPEVALAVLERPHLEVDRVDPWNARMLYPARPTVEPSIEDSDPWASGGDRPQRVAKIHVEKHEKQQLESADPWAM